MKLNNMKFILIVSIALLVGCANDAPITQSEDLPQATPSAKVVEVKPQELANNMITVTGTIIFKNIEGGILGLDGNDGHKYTPRNLKPEYRRPGLVLEITGTINEDLLSYKQYGQMLEVKSVKIIDDSNVGRKSNEY